MYYWHCNFLESHGGDNCGGNGNQMTLMSPMLTDVKEDLLCANLIVVPPQLLFYA